MFLLLFNFCSRLFKNKLKCELFIDYHLMMPPAVSFPRVVVGGDIDLRDNQIHVDSTMQIVSALAKEICICTCIKESYTSPAGIETARK